MRLAGFETGGEIEFGRRAFPPLTTNLDEVGTLHYSKNNVGQATIYIMYSYDPVHLHEPASFYPSDRTWWVSREQFSRVPNTS